MISDVTGDYLRKKLRGAINGVCELDANGKIPANRYGSALNDAIESALSGLVELVEFKGVWDAMINSPLLVNGAPSTATGNMYICSVAGTRFGNDFEIGDWIIYDGAIWKRISGQSLGYTKAQIDTMINGKVSTISNTDGKITIDNTTVTNPILGLNQFFRWSNGSHRALIYEHRSPSLNGSQIAFNTSTITSISTCNIGWDAVNRGYDSDIISSLKSLWVYLKDNLPIKIRLVDVLNENSYFTLYITSLLGTGAFGYSFNCSYVSSETTAVNVIANGQRYYLLFDYTNKSYIDGQYQSLQTQISTLDNQVITLDGQVTTNTNDLATHIDGSNFRHTSEMIDTIYDGNYVSSNNVNKNIQQLDGALTGLNNDISTINGDVVNLSNNLATTNTNVTNLDNATLKKASNLLDLANTTTARTNLNVYSKTEVDNKDTLLQNQITTTNTNLATTNTNVTNLTNNLATTNTNLTTTNTNVTNLTNNKIDTLTNTDTFIAITGTSNARAINLANTISAVRGGTGINTYTIGDLLASNTTTTLSRIADIATGNALLSGGVGVLPSYGKIGLTTHITGTLAVSNGGIGLASYPAVGSLLASATTSTTTTIADIVTGNALLSGGVGVLPSYGKIGLTTHVTGILPLLNGGTNANNANQARQNLAHDRNTTRTIQPDVLRFGTTFALNPNFEGNTGNAGEVNFNLGLGFTGSTSTTFDNLSVLRCRFPVNMKSLFYQEYQATTFRTKWCVAYQLNHTADLQDTMIGMCSDNYINYASQNITNGTDIRDGTSNAVRNSYKFGVRFSGTTAIRHYADGASGTSVGVSRLGFTTNSTAQGNTILILSMESGNQIGIHWYNITNATTLTYVSHAIIPTPYANIYTSDAPSCNYHPCVSYNSANPVTAVCERWMAGFTTINQGGIGIFSLANYYNILF